MRAAIYARYSTELQREASIDDQHRICRRLVDERGWTETKLYADQGLSGSSHLRPAYQTMMMDAHNRKFDVLVAEGIDRLSRDQEHIAALHKQLSYLDIPIITIAEGEISELHIGLKGTMSALFLKDLAQKTHRGLEGRIREGKAAGGISYGYRVIRHLLPDGTFTAGDREIDEQQASIVRRVFRMYVDGMSPRAIASQLNKEHIPGPSGTTWGSSTINGNWRRGTGLLNNELYIGRMIWNRQRFVKDPETGRRQARPNPEDEWVIHQAPELRLLDQQLWDAVKARQNITRRVMETENYSLRPERARRNRYLLSGLLICGCCGGGYTMLGGDRYGCASSRNKGTCDNRRMIKRTVIEERVLSGLRDKLLHADVIAAFAKEFQQEFNQAMQADQVTRKLREADLIKVENSIAQIANAIADGMYHASMKDKMTALEASKNAILAELNDLGDDQPLRLHPNLSDVYRRKVTALTEALNADETTRCEAVELLRSLISKIRITPTDDDFAIELVGELSAIMLLGETDSNKPRRVDNGVYSITLVAGVGFEPTTFRL